MCRFRFFFFKQQTAYEITRRDWSSDVCSSDLLTGQPPFVRADVLSLLAAHRDEPAAFPADLEEGLPADLRAVVLRCLAKDPRARVASARSRLAASANRSAGSLERALAGCGYAG